MKKKSIIYTAVILVVFILFVWVSNFTILGFFLKRNYYYSNYNGTFMHYEDRLKGKSYEGRDNRYRIFLIENPTVKDKQLYRRFHKDVWRFWEWKEIFEHPDRYDFPYIPVRQIQENRRKEGLPLIEEKFLF